MSSRVNWQAYLDGSLSGEELEAAKDLLASSPEAQRELEGLKRFREQLRAAGMSESIPKAKLEGQLSQVTRVEAPKGGNYRWSLSALAIVCSVAFAIWVPRGEKPQEPSNLAVAEMSMADPMLLDRSPEKGQATPVSAVAAASWVSEKTGMATPVLDLGPDSALKLCRYGSDWASYEYEVEGAVYKLFIANKCNSTFKGKRIPSDCALELYEGEGIGWQCPKFSYYLKGGDAAVRRKIAEKIANMVVRV